MLPRRQILAMFLLSLVLAGVALAEPAAAQGRLEAHYTASLAGIPIGKGSWVVEVGPSHYSAAASGITTGLLRLFTGGEGTSAAHGTLNGDKPGSSLYASTIISRNKTDEIRLAITDGDVKTNKVDPPVDDDPERIPVTEAQKRHVQDPMTASLVRIPGDGRVVAPEACDRRLRVFDGRLRYDLALAYKRMDQVKADKGYAGPVVVCSVKFVPIAGYIPSRRAIKYIAEQRDIEVWLAPIAGTRVLVPFRAQSPTPIGEAVLEAGQFVSVATPTRASIKRPRAK
jgi:hypothetical protein